MSRVWWNFKDCFFYTRSYGDGNDSEFDLRWCCIFFKLAGKKQHQPVSSPKSVWFYKGVEPKIGGVPPNHPILMMMGIISDVYGITFDAWCFLPVGRHLLNLGDEANRLPTAVSDSRLLIDPLPPRMAHVFNQANFIGNECQSQAWNKKSSLTYVGANIAPNLRLRDVSFPTTLGTLPDSPQSLFYHQVVTQNGITQAAAIGFETKSYRAKQDEDVASSRSGAELLMVGQDRIIVPIGYFGTNALDRVTAPALDSAPTYVIRGKLPNLDMIRAAAFYYELTVPDSLAYVMSHPQALTQIKAKGVDIKTLHLHERVELPVSKFRRFTRGDWKIECGLIPTLHQLKIQGSRKLQRNQRVRNRRKVYNQAQMLNGHDMTWSNLPTKQGIFLFFLFAGGKLGTSARWSPYSRTAPVESIVGFYM